MKKIISVLMMMVALVVLSMPVMVSRAFAQHLVTTVLLVRHAERSNDSLSPAGKVRADKLVHIAEKAGVKAIFATETQRSQQTVQPLATMLNLTPIIYPYNDMQRLRTEVLSKHAGEVVLVAGHSDTMDKIIQALGGNPTGCRIIGDEFDNLCIITIYLIGKTEVINLQYGEPSPPAAAVCVGGTERTVQCQVGGQRGTRRDVCVSGTWHLGTCIPTAACTGHEERYVRCSLNGRLGYQKEVCRNGAWVRSGGCIPNIP